MHRSWAGQAGRGEPSDAGHAAPAADRTGRSVLWITAELPVGAAIGRHLYSHGLATALAAAGDDVYAMGFCNTPSLLPHDGPIRWIPVPGQLAGGPRSVVSRLPNLAYATRTDSMRLVLERALRSRRWDAILIDHLQMAWTAPIVLDHPASDAAQVAFVTHNHEATVRGEIARSHSILTPKGIALRWDARKARRLEQRTAGAVDVITAITPSDLALFHDAFPAARPVLLLPGYDLPHAEPRRQLPEARRVGIIGSFDWHVKARNLCEFVSAADGPFTDAGIELVIAGSLPDGVLPRRLRATTAIGWVPSVSDFLRECRLGVVSETLGGGFKLKALDHVFNHVPIAAVIGSIEGLPVDDDAMILAAGNAALVREIVAAIDDDDRLHALAKRAHDQCQDAFDWADRGPLLQAGLWPD